jgi:hypothetical protein
VAELIGHLPSLDIDKHRRRDGSLGHTVYRKPHHTNLNLNAELHHYLAESILCYPPWYMSLESSVTRKVPKDNWNSFRVHSYRMATVTGRSIVLSIHLTRRTHLEMTWYWRPSCPLLDQPLVTSGGC